MTLDLPPPLILPDHYVAGKPAIIRPEVDIERYFPVELDRHSRRAIIKELVKHGAITDRAEARRLVEAAIPFGTFVSSSIPSVVPTGTFFRTGSGTSWTFNSVDISDADASRIVVVVPSVAISSNYTITSCTIGGVSATEIIPDFKHLASSNWQYGGMWACVVPTGTTTTIVFNTSGSSSVSYACTVFVLYNVRNLVPFATTTDTAGTLNFTINRPSRSIVVATAAGSAWSGTSGWSWSGLTEIQEVAGAGSTVISIAANAFGTAATGMTISATPTSAPTRAVGMAVAWS